MSSSAYASEEMLRILVPIGGLGRLLDRHAAHRRHPGRPRRRDDLLPGRRPLVPEGGRLLRREPRQLRPQHRPDRRRRPAHQLHDHRRRVGGGRGGRHRSRPPRRSGATAVPLSIALRRAPRLRQPARDPGSRAGVRHPHLLLHRQHGACSSSSAWRAKRPGTSAKAAPSHGHAAARTRQRRADARRLGLLLAPGLRQRELGHDRDRGHLQRGEHLPGAPGQATPAPPWCS